MRLSQANYFLQLFGRWENLLRRELTSEETDDIAKEYMKKATKDAQHLVLEYVKSLIEG